jgi:hypothetical protein
MCGGGTPLVDATERFIEEFMFKEESPRRSSRHNRLQGESREKMERRKSTML